MISVVVCLEAGQGVVAMYAQGCCQCVDGGRHLFCQLFLGDAADGGKAVVEADVLEIVELAEDAELAELGDARQKHKAQVFVTCLERGEELPHGQAKRVELLRVVRDIEEQGVVLINENNESLACLRNMLAWWRAEATCRSGGGG